MRMRATERNKMNTYKEGNNILSMREHAKKCSNFKEFMEAYPNEEFNKLDFIWSLAF